MSTRRTRLKPIPRSRAKTAYGLISDVARVMLEEPKRVDMNCYVAKFLPTEGGPACGTVGCFAGWITLLAGESRQLPEDRGAKHILGPDVDYYTADSDSPGGDNYVFDVGEYEDAINSRTRGTAAYARAVVRRVRKFQRINEKVLRARKLAEGSYSGSGDSREVRCGGVRR